MSNPLKLSGFGLECGEPNKKRRYFDLILLLFVKKGDVDQKTF